MEEVESLSSTLSMQYIAFGRELKVWHDQSPWIATAVEILIGCMNGVQGHSVDLAARCTYVDRYLTLAPWNERAMC